MPGEDVSKHYQGPAPHYGSRIYGRRLLMARQVRGLSRNRLGEMLNVEAHHIRSIERAEVTTVDDAMMKHRFSILLKFPPIFFMTPAPDEQFDAGSTFLCESAERKVCGCGGEATLLCDAREGEGTCDATLCDGCTTKRKDGSDRCALHARRSTRVPVADPTETER